MRLDISPELWRELLIYAHDPAHKDEELQRLLYPVVRRKLQAQIERELFTKYKTAATPIEREAARQQYLDERGIPEDFRTAAEWFNDTN